MVYIGFPVTVEEAHRLFSITAPSKNYYDVDTFNNHVKKFTHIGLHYIDKGTCILGLFVDTNMMDVDEFLIKIIQTKLDFIQELNSLKIDTSHVYFTGIEEETVEMDNPKPIIF